MRAKPGYISLHSLQVEAGDGDVGRQTGGPAGEGLTRRAKLRKERPTLEVRRVGVLKNTRITNTWPPAAQTSGSAGLG